MSLEKTKKTRAGDKRGQILMLCLLLVFQIPAAGQLSFPTVEDYDNHQSILSPAEFTSTAPCHPSTSLVTQTESTLRWKTKDTLVMKSPLLCCLPLQMLSTTGLLNKRQSLFPPCSSLCVATVGATDRRSSAWSLPSRSVSLPLGG